MTILRQLSKKLFFNFRPSSSSTTSHFYFNFRYSLSTSTSTSATLIGDDLENKKLSSSSNNLLSLKKRPFTKKEQETNFGRLIYKTPIYKNIYWCKTLSLSTSMATILTSPYLLLKMIQQSNSYLIPIAYTMFGSLFVFTPLLLNKLTKRVVLEMYYDPQTNLYTAIYFNVFVKKRALRFRFDDVRAAKTNRSFLYTHIVGENLLLLIRQGYLEDEHCSIFESILDAIDDDQDDQNEKGDDDDNDEPAKATTDHHKRQQDQ